jgi:hypothetical protein
MKLRAWTICTILVVLSVPTLPIRASDEWPPFDPDQQREVIGQGFGKSIQLDLQQSCYGTRCSIGPPVFDFRIVQESAGLVDAFKVRNNPDQVDAIIVPSASRAVVVGQVASLVHSITVVDLHTGKTVYDFYCYRPAISPDRRYVVFHRFFPKNLRGASTSDVILVDDLSGESGAWVTRSGVSDVVHDMIPVYPLDNATNRIGDSLVNTSADTHRMERLVWLTATAFSFVDIWRGEYRNVSVRLLPTGGVPTIHIKRIHAFPLVPPNV